MKTKILGGIFALAVMVVTGYGVNRSMQKDTDLSEMALSNVEALADEHVNPDCPNGCIVDGSNCKCYGIHPHYGEYAWDKAK